MHMLALAKDAWNDFANVPMDPKTECMEEAWHGFPAGTHREEIWHWFEDEYGVSVGMDLMGHEDEVIDYYGYNQDRYQLVDFVPEAYGIWNIGPTNMPDGYLPFCLLKSSLEQPFEGGRDIYPDRLLAVRTDGAQKILAAVGAGPQTPKEMREFIEKNKEAGGPWEKAMAKKMEEALPFLEKINWRKGGK